MGIRINKSIGYGINLDRFFELCTFEFGRGTFSDFMRETVLNFKIEELGEYLYGITSLEMSKGYPGELLIDVSDDCRSYRANSLYDIIHDEAIIFYPSASYLDWKRRDDSIDYAFEIYPDINKVSCDTKILYPKHGFYPFNDSVMTLEGMQVPFEVYWYKDSNLIPKIPDEMRWWLKETNLLDDQGINQLRPMMATWWD